LDFCTLKDELSKYDVRFISIREDFDTSTPMGMAMLLICSVFAQLERDTIAERIRDNMIELAKTGRWLGGTTPTGYQSEEVLKITLDGKKRKLYKLSPIERERQNIQLIFEKYREIKSLSGLETYLIQSDIKTKNDIDYSRFALKSILSNPVYAIADEDTLNYFKKYNVEIYADEKSFDGNHAMMVYNKTIQKIGKSKKERNIEEWIISVGKHEGFMSGKEWVEVQELMEHNQEKRYRKPNVNKSLLSGIIYCSECDSYMRPKLNTAIDEDGVRSFSYMCQLKEKSRCQKCKSKNILGLELDKRVYSLIEEDIRPRGKLYEAVKEIARGQFDTTDHRQNELQTLISTKKQNERAINSLVKKIAHIDIEVMGEITNEIKRLKESNAEIEKQIQKLNGETGEATSKEDNAKLVLNIFDTYFKTFHELDLVTQRTLIKLVINTIYYNGEDVVINLVGSEPIKKLPVTSSLSCEGSK